MVAHQIRWFQVDFSTLCQPTAFLMLGDKIPGTDYKLTKFTHKEKARADRPRELKDASELTIVHTRTGNSVILVLNELVQIPASAPNSGEPK